MKPNSLGGSSPLIGRNALRRVPPHPCYAHTCDPLGNGLGRGADTHRYAESTPLQLDQDGKERVRVTGSEHGMRKHFGHGDPDLAVPRGALESPTICAGRAHIIVCGKPILECVTRQYLCRAGRHPVRSRAGRRRVNTPSFPCTSLARSHDVETGLNARLDTHKPLRRSARRVFSRRKQGRDRGTPRATSVFVREDASTCWTCSGFRRRPQAFWALRGVAACWSTSERPTPR